MELLKLKPSNKEYIWGGKKLVTNFNKEYSGDILAETWELSCHPDGTSTIASGDYEGMALDKYIEEKGMEILGENCKQFTEFPILIKFIDANDDLSIQVHPDNEYAQKEEGQLGKTEMWYVVDCNEGSFLYHGFAKEITKDEFKERIENNTLPEVLNKVEVKKGDVFFIEAGTVHAIGKGIVIAEIQQNSNVTYRIFDYGRTDKAGNPRDLHIEKALEATNRKITIKEEALDEHLVVCDYFVVDKIALVDEKREYIGSQDTFTSILVLDGSGFVMVGNSRVTVSKGDSILITAGEGIFTIEGSMEALMTTIPKYK